MNITQVKPLSNGAEISIRSSEPGELPLIQYILKYDLQDSKDSQLQTLIVPGRSLILQKNFVVRRFLFSGNNCRTNY